MNEGQASMYKAIVLIMIVRALLVVINYITTKEGLSQLISILVTTIVLLIGGVLFKRQNWHKYWIWVSNIWFVG